MDSSPDSSPVPAGSDKRSGIIRVVRRENPFVQIDKSCLQCTTLSWGAKGLHSYIMSLPPKWEVRINDLANRSTTGRDGTRSCFKELEAHGLALLKRIPLPGGKWGWETTVFEAFPDAGDSEVGNSEIGQTESGKPVIRKETKKKNIQKSMIGGFDMKKFMEISEKVFGVRFTEGYTRWARFCMAAYEEKQEEALVGWEKFLGTFREPAHVTPSAFIKALQFWIDAPKADNAPLPKPVDRNSD